MDFVPVKTAEAQAALMLMGVRDRLVRQRTQLTNAIRGHASEFGLVTARGLDKIGPLLARLAADAIPWGIVTNKPGWLARPMLAQLQLSARCAALVTGDCLAVKKPDPAPVLRACELVGVDAAACVFVGDDLRDVQAGGAAGLRTIAAAWGYLDGGDPHAWGADHVSAAPLDLLDVLGLR